MGAGGDGAPDGAQRAVAVDLTTPRRAHPELGEPLDHRDVGPAGDHRAVEGADAGAEHQVGDDAALEERAQHADLDGAEDAAATEDERGGQASSGCSARTRCTTRCSTKNISSGTSPAISMRRVNCGVQRAR